MPKIKVSRSIDVEVEQKIRIIDKKEHRDNLSNTTNMLIKKGLETYDKV